MEIPTKRRNKRPHSFEPLDAIDCRMLEALQRDARIRVTELGRLVGLSTPAVTDRMRRFEESGVLSYRAVVNPLALGYTICAIVRVSPQSRKLHVIPKIAQDVPEVTECYRITGEDCYFMKVYLRSIDDLEALLDRFTPHGRTTTSIVHSVPVSPRPLPLPLELN
jgi:Lrp/AsnC family transcriptional regulator, leucine-responsive regulatory protein